MPITLIVYGVVALFLLGGAGLFYKSIGDKKVAAYQAKVDAEEAKIQAATEAKLAVEADRLIDMQASFEAGEAKGRANRPRIAARARADTTTAAVFQNPVCVLPEQSYALLNAAYATLHKGDIPDAMLAIQIAPAVSQPAAKGAIPPTAAPAVPAGATPQKRVVTNPLLPKGTK